MAELLQRDSLVVGLVAAVVLWVVVSTVGLLRLGSLVDVLVGRAEDIDCFESLVVEVWLAQRSLVRSHRSYSSTAEHLQLGSLAGQSVVVSLAVVLVEVAHSN
uniref:Uncharacterized protein n=1 Tax=Anopheles epiroticus TaxID=199890 RepID=A0A182PV27_9DIPT